MQSRLLLQVRSITLLLVVAFVACGRQVSSGPTRHPASVETSTASVRATPSPHATRSVQTPSVSVVHPTASLTVASRLRWMTPVAGSGPQLHPDPLEGKQPVDQRVRSFWVHRGKPLTITLDPEGGDFVRAILLFGQPGANEQLKSGDIRLMIEGISGKRTRHALLWGPSSLYGSLSYGLLAYNLGGARQKLVVLARRDTTLSVQTQVDAQGVYLSVTPRWAGERKLLVRARLLGVRPAERGSYRLVGRLGPPAKRGVDFRLLDDGKGRDRARGDGVFTALVMLPRSKAIYGEVLALGPHERSVPIILREEQG